MAFSSVAPMARHILVLLAAAYPLVMIALGYRIVPFSCPSLCKQPIVLLPPPPLTMFLLFTIHIIHN